MAKWAVFLLLWADLGMWEWPGLAGFVWAWPGFCSTVAGSPVETNDCD